MEVQGSNLTQNLSFPKYVNFSPEKLLRSRNSVMMSIFDHFDSFLPKTGLKGGSIIEVQG